MAGRLLPETIQLAAKDVPRAALGVLRSDVKDAGQVLIDLREMQWGV
jgi:hypothetical protein